MRERQSDEERERGGESGGGKERDRENEGGVKESSRSGINALRSSSTLRERENKRERSRETEKTRKEKEDAWSLLMLLNYYIDEQQ